MKIKISISLHFSLRRLIPCFRPRCFSTNTSSQPTMGNQTTSSQTSELERSSTAMQSETQTQNVAFSIYALPQRNY